MAVSGAVREDAGQQLNRPVEVSALGAGARGRVTEPVVQGETQRLGHGQPVRLPGGGLAQRVTEKADRVIPVGRILLVLPALVIAHPSAPEQLAEPPGSGAGPVSRAGDRDRRLAQISLPAGLVTGDQPPLLVTLGQQPGELGGFGRFRLGAEFVPIAGPVPQLTAQNLDPEIKISFV